MKARSGIGAVVAAVFAAALTLTVGIDAGAAPRPLQPDYLREMPSVARGKENAPYAPPSMRTFSHSHPVDSRCPSTATGALSGSS